MSKLLAFDLGAESGRALVGHFDGKRLALEELHRFANGPVQIFDRLYWDPLHLFALGEQQILVIEQPREPRGRVPAAPRVEREEYVGYWYAI